MTMLSDFFKKKAVLQVANFLNAAIDGDLKQIQLSLQNVPHIIDERDTNGTSAMHFAAARNHLEIVELLIEKGAHIDAINFKKMTPLRFAACDGHAEIVKLLIDHGANIEAADTDGIRPLRVSCSNGHLEAARLLIEKGADLEAKDKQVTPAELTLMRSYFSDDDERD